MNELGLSKIAKELSDGEKSLATLLGATGIGTAINRISSKALDSSYLIGGMEEGKADEIVANFNKKFPKNKVVYDEGMRIQDILAGGGKVSDADAHFSAIYVDENNKLKQFKKPIVAAASDGGEALLQHELGHAKNWKLIPKGIKIPIHTLKNLGFKGSPAISGAMMVNEDLRDKAWIATAAGSLPTYLDEGLASLRAAKEMIKNDGFVRGVQKSLPLVPAFGTYLAPLLGILAATKIVDMIDEKSEEGVQKEAFVRGFYKVAGGPGSGVTGDNAKKIDDMLELETSPIVTIGKRKEFMKNKSPDREKLAVLVEKIKYKGQEKYVPAKLKKFLNAIKRGETWMWDKPVQLIRDREDNFHILDGHHRVLAAIMTGRTLLAADVYTDNVSFRKHNTMKKTAKAKITLGLGKTVIDAKERTDLVDEEKNPDPTHQY